MSSPYIGEIRMFAGTFAPLGWEFCQGQLMSIQDYDTLFYLIGTTYGGDGVDYFALPNLSSRIPVHRGPSHPFASTGGVEAVTLTTNQIPNHRHPLAASTATATSSTPAGQVWAASRDLPYSDAAAPLVPMAPQALGPSGGSQPHDNMPPFLAINFIISMYGIYPTQA